MKNNKSMKITALLLALVLITSCFTVGTFAKYVSKGEGANAARVAKWGVEISAANGLFAKEYTGTDAESITVQATENVVAPGTTGTLSGLKISGTPEVAGTLSFAAEVDLSGWTLSSTREVVSINPKYSTAGALVTTNFQGENGAKKTGVTTNSINVTAQPDWRDHLRDGTLKWVTTGQLIGASNVTNWLNLHPDWALTNTFEFDGRQIIWIETVGASAGSLDRNATYVTFYEGRYTDSFVKNTVTVEETYIPLIVKVGEKEINGLNYTSVDEFVTAVEETIAGFTVEFAPGQDLSTIALPTISWEWPFFTTDENDVKDTLLGNAETAPTISINLTVSATQID